MSVATTGLHSDGTTISYKIGAAAAIPLGEVMDIDPGDIKVTTVNKKRLTPPNHIKKKMKGLIEVGQWKVQLGYKTAQEADLFDLVTGRTEAAFYIDFPDGSQYKIPNGWLASYSPPKPKEDDELQSEIVIENDGTLPVWTEGS